MSSGSLMLLPAAFAWSKTLGWGVVPAKNSERAEKSLRDWGRQSLSEYWGRRSLAGMPQQVRSIVSSLPGFRERAALELENLASVTSCTFFVARRRVRHCCSLFGSGSTDSGLVVCT